MVCAGGTVDVGAVCAAVEGAGAGWVVVEVVAGACVDDGVAGAAEGVVIDTAGGGEDGVVEGVDVDAAGLVDDGDGCVTGEVDAGGKAGGGDAAAVCDVLPETGGVPVTGVRIYCKSAFWFLRRAEL